VGSNCGVGPKEVEIAIETIRAFAPDALLWGEPNAGLPRMEGSDVVYDLGPSDMADFAERAIRAGANVVGSCCGSNPEYTKAIAQRVAGLSR
jgi:methionine synthase I (cobalamin-dependent)